VIVTRLLYSDLVLTSAEQAQRLLPTLQTCPRLLPLIRSFNWPAWNRDPVIKTNYPSVTQLRAKLIDLILPAPNLVTCVFPTIAWPLLALPRAQPTDSPSKLRTLGTVLAVQNQSLSTVLDCPRYESLEELRIWWGDPSSGDVRFPPLLRKLHIRCDNFHHGNNIPLAPFPSSEETRHLPHLTHLSFSFTTIVYPNAPRPPPIPPLLAAVGSDLTHLSLSGDRDSKAENLWLPSGIFALCPKLRVLELANHRPVPAPVKTPTEKSLEGSPSLEEIRYRVDDWYPFDAAHTIDRTAMRDLADLVWSGRTRGRFPKLNTVALVGIPRDFGKRPPEAVGSLLRAIRHMTDLKIVLMDECGRSLNLALDEGVEQSPTEATRSEHLAIEAEKCEFYLLEYGPDRPMLTGSFFLLKLQVLHHHPERTQTSSPPPQPDPPDFVSFDMFLTSHPPTAV
jgi:hypothetical protein